MTYQLYARDFSYVSHNRSSAEVAASPTFPESFDEFRGCFWAVSISTLVFQHPNLQSVAGSRAPKALLQTCERQATVQTALQPGRQRDLLFLEV